LSELSLPALFLLMVWAGLAHLVAALTGLWRLPKTRRYRMMSGRLFWDSVAVAAIFLFISLILPPLVAPLGVALLIYFYDRKTNVMVRRIVWGEHVASYESWLPGTLSWLLIFPSVQLISAAVLTLLKHWNLTPLPEQLAVEKLRSVLDQPLPFALLALETCLIIPWIEELFFRGYLQGLFSQNLSRRLGILISSALFTLCHLAPAHGWRNLELAVSLGVLALFLGFLKERFGSLAAPIGLHITFNSCSLLWILYHT